MLYLSTIRNILSANLQIVFFFLFTLKLSPCFISCCSWDKFRSLTSFYSVSFILLSSSLDLLSFLFPRFFLPYCLGRELYGSTRMTILIGRIWSSDQSRCAFVPSCFLIRFCTIVLPLWSCIHYSAFSSPLVIVKVLPPAILTQYEKLRFVIRSFNMSFNALYIVAFFSSMKMTKVKCKLNREIISLS